MDRQLKGNTAQNYGLGRVYLEFLFKTNNTSDPGVATLVGTTGGTAGAGQAPPPVITSITRAAAGKLLVTMSNVDTFNKVIYVTADLDDSVDDGAYCTVGNVSNEATAGAGITFNVFTRAATGTKTDYTGRVVRVSFVGRNTSAGQ